MIDDVVRDFGNMPPLLRDGLEITYLATRPVIEEFCKRRNKKLIKIGIAPREEHPGDERLERECLKPIYFFEGDEKGYTIGALKEDLMHSEKTEVIILNRGEMFK